MTVALRFGRDLLRAALLLMALVVSVIWMVDSIELRSVARAFGSAVGKAEQLAPVLVAVAVGVVATWWERTRRWMALRMCGRSLRPMLVVCLVVGSGVAGLTSVGRTLVPPGLDQSTAGSFERAVDAEGTWVRAIQDRRVAIRTTEGRVTAVGVWPSGQVAVFEGGPFERPTPRRSAALDAPIDDLWTHGGSAQRIWLGERVFTWMSAGVLAMVVLAGSRRMRRGTILGVVAAVAVKTLGGAVALAVGFGTIDWTVAGVGLTSVLVVLALGAVGSVDHR